METSWKVVLYYSYCNVGDATTVESLRKAQKELCSSLGLFGRILIASEGINGTLSAPDVDGAVDCYIRQMKADPRFASIDWKTSFAAMCPFPDLSVRVVNEIVGYGAEMRNVDVTRAGKHLSPEDFHRAMGEALKKKEVDGKCDDTVIVDIRNNFEHSIGRFAGAVNPNMRITSDFKPWVDNHLEELQGKKVLLYCTGGVRCEKASAYLLTQPGVADVNQLSGGIHRYFEHFPDGGYFRGKNFVFDARVAIAPPGAERSKVDTEESEDDVGVGTFRDKESSSKRQKNDLSEVVGLCGICESPFDRPRAEDVCCVCKAVCLVCDSCRITHDELHCPEHAHLRDCYFWFLGKFTDVTELQRQYRALELLEVELKNGSEGAKATKNRRRTLRRQMARITARISELEHGQQISIGKNAEDSSTTKEARWSRRCRWCEKILLTESNTAVSSELYTSRDDCCNGKCWGFWKPPPRNDLPAQCPRVSR